MRKTVFSYRILIVPVMWLLFGLLVSVSTVTTNSRRPRGAPVLLPSLTVLPHLGGRAASSFGSFLSTKLPLRRSSFRFGSPGETGAREALPQETQQRPLFVGSRQRTPSGVWSRDDETPNQVQPKKKVDSQQKQNQQQRQQLGRFARLREALQRMRGAAKYKLQRLWQRIRRGASRAKHAARQAAVRVYRRLPRLRKPQGPSGKPQEAAASRLAGAGLVGPAASLGPAEETLEATETPEKGEASTPVSPSIPTTSTSAEEAAAPPVKEGTTAPASEGHGQAEETEEWHEALTPEQVESANEEWHDAVTPEELDQLLARARESEKLQKEKEPVAEEVEGQKAETDRRRDEADELGLSPQCLKFLPSMPGTVKQLIRDWRGHCMFWTLFLRHKGNLGARFDDLEILAAQTRDSILRAEGLKGTEHSLEAQILRMTLALALGEEVVAKAADASREFCWFLNPDNLFKKANSREEAVLENLHPVSFFANPLHYMQPLRRLVEMVYADSFRCLSSIQTEIIAREELQGIFGSEKQKLETTLKQLTQSLSGGQTGDVLQAIGELEMLRNRESCSIEQSHLDAAQAKNIQAFVADYRVNGMNWWRAQWPLKLQACRPLNKGSSAVPQDISETCRAYESSSPPKNGSDVGTILRWLWEAGSCNTG
ncbi:hypothetical protein EBH_0079920 [Eimeria brunetti]|uniref:Uncharacterized protein n=1 Tax=Eimeria brunetti TaxID=51314 RepID=U6M1Z8_9EIME|nr:hypothetical protein EBH_0079920 [Eimeria brunetti]